jgi:hypothetical protein
MPAISGAVGDAIAIYPEVVPATPFGARRVVRWALNNPGLLGGETRFADDEMVRVQPRPHRHRQPGDRRRHRPAPRPQFRASSTRASFIRGRAGEERGLHLYSAAARIGARFPLSSIQPLVELEHAMPTPLRSGRSSAAPDPIPTITPATSLREAASFWVRGARGR